MYSSAVVGHRHEKPAYRRGGEAKTVPMMRESIQSYTQELGRHDRPRCDRMSCESWKMHTKTRLNRQKVELVCVCLEKKEAKCFSLYSTKNSFPTQLATARVSVRVCLPARAHFRPFQWIDSWQGGHTLRHVHGYNTTIQKRKLEYLHTHTHRSHRPDFPTTFARKWMNGHTAWVVWIITNIIVFII